MPNVHDGGYGTTSYSYTNSLIFNKKVLVPIYGKAQDQAALDIYKQILPGYDVKGFDCNDIITANGAIHCITKLVAKAPVTLQHDAVRSSRAGEETPVRAFIETVNPVNPEGVCAYWSNSQDGPFKQVRLLGTNGNYEGAIPAQQSGTSVYYYLEAEDATGIYKTLPSSSPENGTYSYNVN
jgi:agmatine deiminase